MVRVAVAAPHPAGVAAARSVVEQGGGAVDAAVAAAAALTVAYPHQCSVGGDLVAVVRSPGGAVRVVLSIGAAPAGFDVDALRAAGERMPSGGPLSVTVPGAVAGWAAVAGLTGPKAAPGGAARLGLDRLVAPAVALAADGVPISRGLARATTARTEVVRADPGLAALLLDAAGRPRGAGEELRQPALAQTLRAVGEDWRGFYAGGLARRLAAGAARLGSPLDAADLRAHRPEVAAPLRRRIGDVTWSVTPPPTQGAALLAVLGSAGSPVVAARRAERARDALLGDPRVGPIDLAGLLLDAHRDPDALPSGPRPAGDTVAVTAVADDGTAVALIQSVFQSFGSGLLDPGTGVVLHNRGSAFSLDPAHPGAARPGARPPHTLCPALAEGGAGVVALGCQGGRAQAWILSLVAADVLRDPDLHATLARPRWVIGSRDLGRSRPTLVLEPGTPGAAELDRAARRLGLAVETTPGLHDDAGHVQVARLRRDGVDAASDVRADGVAAVLGGARQAS